jgi:hypothetical protein
MSEMIVIAFLLAELHTCFPADFLINLSSFRPILVSERQTGTDVIYDFLFFSPKKLPILEKSFHNFCF